MAEHRVVVVGAGMGGLASAIDLARQGARVCLLEAAAQPGGKMRQVQVGGVGIDAGPTVFTLRWVFEQLFDAAGERFSDHVQVQALQVLARHAWRSGGTLDLFAQRERSADAIARFSSPAEARRFIGFCDQARQAYDTLEAPYIRSQRPTLWQMGPGLGLQGLRVLTRLGPFFSLWRNLGQHFHDPRLRQLFGRYATYCGSSPMLAPATLMLIAQVEMDGVWSVEGGMTALARGLAGLAQRLGVEQRYDTPVARILTQHGRASGVQLADGETLPADDVVFAGDSAALAAGLLGSEVTGAVPSVPRSARSLSALTWKLRAPTSGFALTRHNVFFDEDYATEFSDIFERGRLPGRGTVYVCAQDRHDHGLADAGAREERLLCLVNAPARGDDAQPHDEEIAACEQRSFALLQACGLQVQPNAHRVLTGPREFDRLFPGSGGALYGQASHGWMASFRRPGGRSAMPGLYLAGGSVHPGPGVPMATLSGRLAAATLMADRASTSRFHRVVIPGGMSMR